MLEKIISGGRTGANQAGWRVAPAFGIPTGGWMPHGFLTEDGPRPEFANLYAAVEMRTDDDPIRIRRNAAEAHDRAQELL
jgi:Circularly permutated YpsA SLOG family